MLFIRWRPRWILAAGFLFEELAVAAELPGRRRRRPDRRGMVMGLCRVLALRFQPCFLSVHILQMNGDSYRLNQSKHRSRRANSDTPADNPTHA